MTAALDWVATNQYPVPIKRNRAACFNSWAPGPAGFTVSGKGEPDAVNGLKIRRFTLLALLLVGSLLGRTAATGPARASQIQAAAGAEPPLQTVFASAAQEFGVPQGVLLSVSYNLSRWEDHNGEPSTSGGYGPMHLTDVDTAPALGGKGETAGAPQAVLSGDPGLHTLDAAASLLGLSPDTLKRDPVQNIRGGAALLAQYARQTVGGEPADEARWYGAVAKYSGSRDAAVALDFADSVYATMRSGAAGRTAEGQQVRLAAEAVSPDTSSADRLHLRDSVQAGAECPIGLACRYVPAAYQQNDPNDPGDYGNYDLASRERDGLDIQYIVIHDTETPYDATIRLFQNPRSYVSSHYVLRASDGEITQMVRNRHVAYTAGNWYVNTHSINLEHEGYAIEGATWYSERMYRTSARLVRYLAQTYGIPLDRSHIIGHDGVPGPTAAFQAGMHWDPGPFWDWAHYMALMGAPVAPSGGDLSSSVVTINPSFATNKPQVSYCYPDGCRDVKRQSASFVYLRTAPSFGAPLADDPALPGPGTTRAYDWGDKAATGQQFYRAGRRGNWDAIYYGGQKVWYYNPPSSSTAVPGSGTLVTPKAGLQSITVYGRAYPEAGAYSGTGVPVQSISPLQYSIPAGQVYVAQAKVRGDYYRAVTYNTPNDYRVVEGTMEYYPISFNHRLAFVKASDVVVVPAR